MYSISELSVGKMLTVHHHGIEKKFRYDGFEINYFKLIISSLMRSLEKFWKACKEM